MKLTCPQDKLSKGLQIVGRAVSQRSPLPITSNILLETEEERLKLTATNLEIAVTTWMEASVEEAGRITLPARLLTEFVNALPNEAVTLAPAKGAHSCQVRAGRFEAEIRGINADEFPGIPVGSDQPTASIDSALLREMIDQVAFAAAADDTRPVLTGVHCTFSGADLTMAAADSFRLSTRTASLDGESAGDFSIIIPARTLTELGKILPEGGDTVALTVTPNRSQVVFRTDNLVLVSRLIEGAFPNVKQLIPTKFQTSLTANRSELLTAARVASFFSRDNSNMILLDVTSNGTGGTLTVTGSAAEVGENHGELDVHVEGEEIHVAFNSRYVAEALAAIQSQQVGLGLTGPKTAAVIRPVDSEQYTQIVMPIQTSS